MRKQPTGFARTLVYPYRPVVFFSVCSALVAILSLMLVQNAPGQRIYQTDWSNTAPTLDGVASPGEWDAAPEITSAKLLRTPAPGTDGTETLSVRVLWTGTALYVLVQSDYGAWNGPVGPVDFNADNLNIYFDPNGDGEANDNSGGQDSYQITVSQPLGDTVLTEADTPLFVEAHVNDNFGNAGGWAPTGIQVAQINTDAGGTLEMCIPFSDLNVADDGLDSSTAPSNGDKWFFQVGRISSDAANLLPVLSYHEGQFFAERPMGVLVFQDLGSLADGFTLRQLDLTSAGGAEQINNHVEAVNFLDNTGDPSLNLNVENDLQLQRPVVDIAGGGGNFPVNDPYLDGQSGTGKEDVTVRATSTVTIPAGTWTIAFGSDDGGLVKVDGVTFVNKFRENGTVLGPDSVHFEGNRGHQWTGGTFTLAEETTTTLTASFHERGGGDSFEIAIRDASADGGDPAVFDPADDPNTGFANGWFLLSDGMCGWQLEDDGVSAIYVGGKGRIGSQTLATTDSNEVFGDPVVSPGLTQTWYQRGNGGSLQSILDFIATNPPTAGPAKGETGTWWTGNGGSIPGVQAYPDFTAGMSRDNYTVCLEGEIFIPEDGEYQFKDGVDDYTYLEIDGEALVDDNTWTGVEGNQNGGSPIVSKTFDVADGGEWLPILMYTAEGGGGDAGVLYWDYDPTADEGSRLGGGVGFPTANDQAVDLAANGAALLVPDTHLRGSITPLESVDRTASLMQAADDVYVEADAFTENPYDGADDGEDGRRMTTVTDSPGLNDRFAFNGTSPGFDAGDYITSTATFGNFKAGDRVVITFHGAWDPGFIQTPAPNWEINTVTIDNGGPTADFDDGPGGFQVVNTGSVEGPWVYNPATGAWSADGGTGVVTSDLNTPEFTVASDGPITVSFTHRYNFEDDGTIRWDGGGLFYSVNAPTYVFDLDGDNKTADSLVLPDNPDPSVVSQQIDISGASIEVGLAAGELEAGDAYQLFNTGGALFKLDFGNEPPNANGTAAGWDGVSSGTSFGELRGLDNGNSFPLTDFGTGTQGVTITALDDDFNPNNSGAPGAGANFDGVDVPVEVNDDYLFKEDDTPGTSARLRVDGLPAGTYNVTLFEGRTTDSNQVGKIWAGAEGDEPAAANTGNFANGGTTVSVTVSDGDSLYYAHLEDGSGGISGMIIRETGVNQLVGNYGSLSLPRGQWDTSGLNPGGDGTIRLESPSYDGFVARFLNVTAAGGFEQINTLTEAIDFLNNTGTANINVEADISQHVDVVDFAGGGGNFPVNNPYPDGSTGTGHDDFTIRATANVVIPAGTWQAAVGSDDGGSIQIPGVMFTDKFGENGPVLGDDTVQFDGTRGHGWTGGTFTLTEPLETMIIANMFERGGGDSMEVAIRDASGGSDNNPADGGWELAANGALGWSITSPPGGDATYVAGLGRSGTQVLSGSRTNEVFDLAETTPGLTQEWFQAGNPGNIAGVLNVVDNQDPTAGPFKGLTGTWWTGNGGVIPGTQTYPSATAGMSRDNYMTRLDGEIFIPEDGTYNFKDGVDDFTHLMIDGDVLIDDNTWTGVETNQNGGSPIVSKTFDVADGGEWLPITMYTAEGGGGDAGILYWDYQVCDPANSYFQSFDAADGTTDLGDGSVIAGAEASIVGNRLQLTKDGVAGGFSSFSVPALPGSSDGWHATFQVEIFDSEGANPPADGFSFNYGNATLGTLGAAEEGIGVADAAENLSFEVDTWMNFDAEQGVNISGNAGGTDVGQLAFTNGPILDDGQTVVGRVFVSWDPVTGASFTTTGFNTNADFVDVATTFTPDDGHNFIISARVGGANQDVFIDNLMICTDGAGLNAGVGFPTANDQAIDLGADAIWLQVPDTHLRGQIIGLISADLVASLDNSKPLVLEAGDQIAIDNPDPDLFTTILDLNNADIEVTGTLSPGDVLELFAPGLTLQGQLNSLTLPAAPAGVVYDTSGLQAGGNGTLVVLSEAPFVLTEIVKDPDSVTLTWNSRPGNVSYAIDSTRGVPNDVVLSDENFDTGDGGYTVDTPVDYEGPWVYDPTAGSWGQDGQVTENGMGNDSMLNSPAFVVSGPNTVSLSFQHRHSFEVGSWDGGQVRVSVNGGPYTLVPGSAFGQNGYNGVIANNPVNSIQGQEAFVETPAPGYTFVTSTANLGLFSAGDTVSVQFFAGNDANTNGPDSPNWEITSVTIVEQDLWKVAATGILTQGISTTTTIPDSGGPTVLPGLMGGDLTDPENDGDPEADVNYNATFAASEEEGFGGGEFAFNIWDNQVGGGNAKWCCGTDFPLWASAEFTEPKVITHFTVTSGNDTPDRDPRVWEIQGSSDGGTTWETIFRQDDSSAGLWTARNQTLLFEAGLHFDLPSAYPLIRMITFETGLTTGAFYQLNEVELFDDGEVKRGGIRLFRAREE